MINSINVNPDIKNPPSYVEGEAIVISRPNQGWNNSPKIDKWADAPVDKDVVLYSRGGKINWLQVPEGMETYVLGSINGIIQWIATEDCDAV